MLLYELVADKEKIDTPMHFAWKNGAAPQWREDKRHSWLTEEKKNAEQVSFTDWQEMKVLFPFNRKAAAFMSKTKHQANNKNPQSLNSTWAH